MKTRALTLLLAVLAAGPARPGTPEEDLALGVKQVEEGDFQAALQTLEGASRRLAGDKAKSKELARAYFYIGMAYVGMSQETEARSKFLQAWRSDPGLRPSTREFPPRIVNAFEEAIKAAPVDAASVTLLMDAAKRDDVAGMRLLLQRTPALLSAKDKEFGATALHWATLRGNTLAIAFLIGAGADIGARNSAGETPFDIAQRNKGEELFPYLQSPGPGLPAAQGEIFEAVQRGDLGRVRQIVAADPASVNRKDPEFGASPLHWAALKGFSATAAYLLGAGADPAARNGSGETPATVAERAKKTDVAELLRP
jgi:hypothetical protein